MFYDIIIENFNTKEVLFLNYEVEEFCFTSSNKVNTIHGKIIKPVGDKFRGVFQISHGMCEYFDKYKIFIEYMTKNGFIVCGNDHIGHGNSINDEQDMGYFLERDGYKFLIKDVRLVYEMVHERYPDLPYYFFGHSMGSLILRCYVAKFGSSLDGLILCGTVGPQVLAEAGIKLANAIAKAKGDHYRSRKLYDLSLNFANVKFIPAKTRFDWITSDENEIKRRMSDKKSDFIFTVSGFSDLFHLVSLANSPRVAKTIPKDLPIFIISGALDPIGENGKGVSKVVKLYRSVGLTNIRYKLYPMLRHELWNEVRKDEVYNDIIKWIEEDSKKNV